MEMDFEERVRRRNEFDASLVYGTRKFNLLTRRDEHSEYRRTHDAQWMDPETGIIHDRFAEARACPLCNADRCETLFVKAGFPHVKCQSCGLVYVNPILNQAEYEKLWREEESWENVLETEDQIRMQALEARYSLDIASIYLGSAGPVRVCDVGCGPGTLLAEAREKGFQVFGIEPNRKCHPSLEKKGIPYTGDYFPLKDFKDKFDCVFILNTLEHLRKPAEIVGHIREILKPSGLIYVSVPSMDALVNRVLHEKAGVFGGHSHVQFFNIRTLSALLNQEGFEVLDSETIITEIGVIRNALSFKDPYFGDNADALEFITPELIYRNHLARNVNMVGRLVRK